MSKHIVIVESPAKCKKIEKILGSEYKCIATYGHIYELSSLEQVDFHKYEQNKYKIIKTKRDKIKTLGDTIKKAVMDDKDIIIASDNDREGEGIAYHLCLNYNLPISDTKRIIFNEITETAITNAINNPTKIDIDMVHSQQTRQILDLCLGFKVSPLLWKNVYYGLSAGRCQTPALRMIYDTENEVKEYCKNPLFDWNGSGKFGDKNWTFKLNMSQIETINDDFINKFLEECIKYDFFVLRKNIEKLDKRYPPSPLITSSLQQQCYKVFGIPSKSTMKYAQDLYENGLITYMRTDSTKMSKDFVSNVVNYIKKEYGDDFVSSSPFSRCENKKKGATQDAHECIRITNINLCSLVDNEKFTENHKKIYKFIWKNTIQSLMKESIYSKVMLIIDSPQKCYFEKIIYKCEFIGYEILNTNNSSTNTDYEYLKLILPDNNSKMCIKNHEIVCENTIVKIPKLMNESMLIKKMENYNIGRPSTYASIIQSLESKYLTIENQQLIGSFPNTVYLLDNNNIKKNETMKEVFENKKFKINEKGINALEYLSQHFEDIFSYEFTTKMECELDNIANGLQTKFNVCNDFNNSIDNIVNLCSISDDTTTKYKIKNTITKINMGKHENNAVYLCKGKFGFYLEHKKNKFSIDENIIPKTETFDNISFNLSDAINHIVETNKNKESKIIRVINNESSIRISEHGEYIYYKTNKMKKPLFISLKNMQDVDFKTCEQEVLIEYINNERQKPKPKYRKYKKYKK